MARLLLSLLLLLLLSGPAARACLHHHHGARRSPQEQTWVRKRHWGRRNTDRVAITNVRVFDGYRMGDAPATVFIDGAVISAVDASDAGANLTGSVIVDGTGKFLIPGLIDSHAHPFDVASMENLTSFGVTTVLNMACGNYTACHLMRGLDGLASFFSAGLPAMGNGSAHARILDESPADLVYPDSNPALAVSRAFASGTGSDFYKIIAEDNGPSAEIQVGLVRQTHALGRRAMTHAATVLALQQAVASGTDGLQHLPVDGLLPADTVAAAAAVPARGQSRRHVTPTFNIFKFGLHDPNVRAFVSSDVPAAPYSYATLVRNLAALRALGMPTLAGTDAVGPMPGTSILVPFGVTVHWELENLVEAGLSAAEALRAATSEPALQHRLPGRGVIAPGYRADLVLLNSDPLANISNTQDMARVWAGGVELYQLGSFAEWAYLKPAAARVS